jgi:hypothetical protein
MLVEKREKSKQNIVIFMCKEFFLIYFWFERNNKKIKLCYPKLIELKFKSLFKQNIKFLKRITPARHNQQTKSFTENLYSFKSKY